MEIIDESKVLIYGVLDVTMYRKDFDMIFIADKIIDAKKDTFWVDLEGAKEDTSFLYYKSICYLMDKNGIMRFRQIRFEDKNTFISYNGERIDSTSTLENIRRLFPDAVKKAEDWGMHEFEEEDQFHPVVVLSSDDENACEWLFFFENGNLFEIMRHLPYEY